MAINKEQMLALLADNTSGDISAEDMRDIITGLVALEDEWIEAREEILFADKTGTEPLWQKGQVYFSDGKLNVNTNYTGVTLQVGEEQHIEVYNNSGSTIQNGKVVRYSSIASGLPSIVLAQADTFSNSIGIGVATMDIENETSGLVTVYGLVRGLDLSSFQNGEVLYISETEAGNFTSTAPDIATKVGSVFSNDSVTGSIFIKPEVYIVLPTILAYMNNGVIQGTTLDATYRDVANYSDSGNVVMLFNSTAGTITIPSTGIYSININLGVLFDTIGNSEETISLRVNGSISGNTDILVTAPRNSASAGAYPKVSFSATEGEVVRIQLACTSDTLTNVSLPLMTFEIESKHIR